MLSAGGFLGKAGFPKCVEILDADTTEVFANKIVPKWLLLKQSLREMSMDTSVHCGLSHHHDHGIFEDNGCNSRYCSCTSRGKH